MSVPGESQGSAPPSPLLLALAAYVCAADKPGPVPEEVMEALGDAWKSARCLGTGVHECPCCIAETLLFLFDNYDGAPDAVAYRLKVHEAVEDARAALRTGGC